MKTIPKPRKKYERGLTKKALIEIKNLVPHFTSYQLAARTQMTVEQAQKCCGYLKKLGYIKVIGSARLAGKQGEPSSVYEPTPTYEEARKKSPSLFEPLHLAPITPIDKARKSPEVDPKKNYQQLCQKVDGLIEVVDSLVMELHLGLQKVSLVELEKATKMRETLKSLKENKL